MAHNCSLGAHLVVGPAQFMLDWLVVVLDPIPQAVDLIDLLGADLRGGQRRRQIPGGFGLQVRWVQGGRNQTHAPSRAIGGSEFEFDEVAHQLFPMAVEAHRALPGVEWQTRSRFGGGEGGGMGLIFHPLPHPMRGAQSHHIRDLGSEQLAFQRGILAIDGVGDDQTEGDARRARLLDQVPRQRRLGVEVGIFAALRQSTGRPIGPHAQGHMTAAVCPLARHRHHAIGHMPQLAQILLGGEHNPVTALGIARLIDDEHAARMGAQIRMRLPVLESSPIERLGVPRRIVQEVMQRLPIGSGHDAGEFDERLVMLARQQQPDQVLPQRASFLITGEEVVKGGTKLVDRLGGRWRGLPRSAHRTGSSRAGRLLAHTVYHT